MVLVSSVSQTLDALSALVRWLLFTRHETGLCPMLPEKIDGADLSGWNAKLQLLRAALLVHGCS